MKKITLYSLALTLYLPLVVSYLCSRNRRIIDSDVLRWVEHQPQHYKGVNCKVLCAMIAVVIKSEFRKQLIWRLGGVKRFFFELLYGNCNSLYIERDAKIGDGFMVVHGAGVVIGGGCCIGKNFTIYQNSTVGWNKGFPKIGNNVYVGAGAVIIGDINIGDNVKIGAGTVVVDDIPNNSTVVGIKPRVIMHNKNQ